MSPYVYYVNLHWYKTKTIGQLSSSILIIPYQVWKEWHADADRQEPWNVMCEFDEYNSSLLSMVLFIIQLFFSVFPVFCELHQNIIEWVPERKSTNFIDCWLNPLKLRQWRISP